KGRAIAKATPKRPPAAAAGQPRLSLSSGAPGVVTGRGATATDREKAQQEQAGAIEADTQVLHQRIVELTALVEGMQQELRAQEIAQRTPVQAARATPQEPATPASSDPAKAALEPAKAVLESARAGVEPAKAAPGEAQKSSALMPAR